MATLASFLLLVVPGLVFEIVYERKRPPRQTSVFREVCNVALVGTISSILSMGLFLVIELWQPNFLIDFQTWTRTPHSYEMAHSGRIFVLIILVTGFSCLLSGLLAFVLEVRRGDIKRVGFSANTAIYNAVHRGAADKNSTVQLQVATTHGTYMGTYEFLDPYASRDEGWLVLRDVQIVVGNQKQSVSPWQRVALPYTEIVSVLTQFING